MSVERENYEACIQFQAYYDSALRTIGARAPEPMPGQRLIDYRVETCRTLKRTYLPEVHEYYQVDYRGLRNNIPALNNYEPQLIQACLVEARNPKNVPPGEIREIVKMDSNGLKVHEFIGRDCFVKDMGRPGRRAKFRQLSFADYK